MYGAVRRLERGGWRILVTSFAVPFVAYTAATGVTVTIGEGIMAKITTSLGKSGVDSLAQAIARGGVENIDWGDALIEGMPASKYVKAVLKAAINLSENGFDSPKNSDKILSEAALNIFFAGLKTKASPDIEDFVINKVVNKTAKDLTKDGIGLNEKEKNKYVYFSKREILQ